MSGSNSFHRIISRRRAIALGGSFAGGLMASSSPLLAGVSRNSFATSAFAPSSSSSTSLPVDQIEDILQTPGTVMNGVLSIEQDRTDLHVMGPHGIPFKPSWEINNGFAFQPIGDDHAIFNGDICILPDESNHALDRIVHSKLLVQMAFHQHFFELTPQVFFMHFRAVGDPLEIAKEVANVVAATRTPLPQMPPANPTTPLNAERLADILGGSAQVGGDGVVTVSIARKETIVLAGVALKPETGVSTTVAFEPLESNEKGDEEEHGDAFAAVAPDFALIASEVNPVFRKMRDQNWQIHCLYNQETAEHPQLYFSHQLKSGNAYKLAQQIRNGLNLTNSAFMS